MEGISSSPPGPDMGGAPRVVHRPFLLQKSECLISSCLRRVCVAERERCAGQLAFTVVQVLEAH